METTRDTPRGIIDRRSGERRFRLARYRPAADLEDLVEHYWSVRWDLRGQQPFRQETLPHPSVCIAVEPGRAEVVGVVTGRFARVLEGQGRVFGIKFRPGGFYPLLRGTPVATLTDRVVPVRELLGGAGAAYGEAVARRNDDPRSVALADEWLRSCGAEPDENCRRVRQIVETIAEDRDVTRVDHVARTCGLAKRALQRLFHRYVGVPPKWVIQRYRLHEALARIDRGESLDWAELALSLGYCDQPHFVKDFKSLIGRTPDEYARGLGSAGGDPCVV